MVEIPRDPKNWTVDDLARLPDDGQRYELLDGVLLVSPAPAARHQAAAGELYKALSSAAPAELSVSWRPWTGNPITGPRSSPTFSLFAIKGWVRGA